MMDRAQKEKTTIFLHFVGRGIFECLSLPPSPHTSTQTTAMNCSGFNNPALTFNIKLILKNGSYRQQKGRYPEKFKTIHFNHWIVC